MTFRTLPEEPLPLPRLVVLFAKLNLRSNGVQRYVALLPIQPNPLSGWVTEKYYYLYI